MLKAQSMKEIGNQEFQTKKAIAEILLADDIDTSMEAITKANAEVDELIDTLKFFVDAYIEEKLKNK